MPVLHLLVGPNGAGKTTFYERLLRPTMDLPFVNADFIAKAMWPGDEERHGHDAARLADKQRETLLVARRSFIAETVFSHTSKLDFLRRAKAAGYLVTLHVVVVPEELAVERTRLRSSQGGHSVPEDKVRARFRRLWGQVGEAIPVADEVVVYDNSRARKPYQEIARYIEGSLISQARWPSWSPLSK